MGIKVLSPQPTRTHHTELSKRFKEVLTKEAKEFIAALHNEFDDSRRALLKDRVLYQKAFDNGQYPEFPPETRLIREGDWVAAPLPEDMLDRRVEITGPVERKMVINALNSGASIFMADFEDSNAPTWENNMNGQLNLMDAVRKSIFFVNENGKEYKLNTNIATLIVRPRGLHLEQKNLTIDDVCISASLMDFGLYFFHNVDRLINSGSGPYFYLPKLENYKEARWWNEVFEFSQKYLGIPIKTIKATVLIETITASFQIDEIIYELKDHIAGLNCGRWDYIFSYIKKFRNHEGFDVPDRDQITMTSPFMEAYSLKVIQSCHKRNIHAIGGMSAFIPIKNDEKANQLVMEKIIEDKIREVKNGHDGTWVAHPGLVQPAMEIFNEYMPDKNQIHKKREEIVITESDLLMPPKGTITEEGIRKNINVGILYLESWLNGKGAVALYNLMEDTATAEISRTQLWLWLKNESAMADGRIFDIDTYMAFRKLELKKIMLNVGTDRYQSGKFILATTLFDRLVLGSECEEFLTLSAYQYI